MVERASHGRHFLRDWRLAAHLTLEQAAERIERQSEEWADAGEGVRTMSMTHQNLGKIERGIVPYNQHLLEVLAAIYRAPDIGSLITRRPTDEPGVQGVKAIPTEGLAPEQVELLENMAAQMRRAG